MTSHEFRGTFKKTATGWHRQRLFLSVLTDICYILSLHSLSYALLLTVATTFRQELPSPIMILILLTSFSIIFWRRLKSFKHPYLSNMGITLRMIEVASRKKSYLAGMELSESSSPYTSQTMKRRAVIRAENDVLDANLLQAFQPLKSELHRAFLLLMFTGTGALITLYALSGITDIQKPVQLTVFPGSLSIPHGSSLEVGMEIKNTQDSAQTDKTHDGKQVLMFIQDTSGNKSQIALNLKDGKVSQKLDNVVSNINYWFQFRNQESQHKRIEVFLPPFARDHSVFIQYPSYTRMAPSTKKGGDIMAPEGSSATVSVKSSRAASKGVVLMKDGHEIIMEKEGSDTFYASIKITEDDQYQTILYDSEGRSSLEPPLYQITALKDSPPAVDITEPGADLAAGSKASIPLVIRTRDDFGTDNISLEIYREGITVEIMVKNFEQPRTDAVSEFDLELAPMNLRPGQLIQYRAKASDMKVPPGIGFSTWYSIFIPSSQDILKGAADDQQVMLEQARNLLEKHQEIVKKAEETVEEIRMKGEIGWQEEQDIKKIISEEQAVLKEAEQLSEMLSENEKTLSESDMLTMQTIESMQRVRELMESVIGEEMTELMKKMQEMSSSSNVDPAQLEEFSKNFDRSEHLNRLKVFENLLEKIMREMELTEIASSLEDIGYRESMLQISDSPEELKSAKSEHDELIEQLKNTRSRMTSSATDLPAQFRENLTELANYDGIELLNEMQLTSELMQNSEDIQSLSRASENKTKSASKAREMAENVRNLLTKLQNQDKANILNALSSLIRNTATLAKEIHIIRGELTTLLGNEARDKAEYLAELRALATNYASITVELSGQTAFINGMIPVTFINASDSIRAAAEVLDESNPGRAAAPLEMATVHLSEASISLFMASKKVDTAESASGIEDIMRQLKEMADRQGGIGNQTDDLLSSLMSGMSGSSSEMMRRLAMEQAALGKDLQKLQEKMGSSSNAAGRLDQLAERMAQIARSMETAEGGGSSRVVEEQKMMVQRLLEARRALNKGKEGRQREAKAPDIQIHQAEIDTPLDLFSISRGSADAIRSFNSAEAPEAYRDLVNSYFRTLSEFIQ